MIRYRNGRDIVRSGSAGRRGSRGRHGAMRSSYTGMTSDAIGHVDMMGGSSGIDGMVERLNIGTSQHAASSSRQDSTRPLSMDLPTFIGILVEMSGLCRKWYGSLYTANIAEDVRDHLQYIQTVCEAIIDQTTESGIQQRIAAIFEMLHSVMVRMDTSPTRWGFRMKSEFKDLMCRLDGRERVLRADLEVARKYSIVVRLINKMFTNIDAEISRMDTDQSHVKLALKLMRRGWRRYFGDVIEGILWGTYKWLEESREGDNPWQNPEPGARPQLWRTDPVVARKYSIVLRLINEMLTAVNEELSTCLIYCRKHADLKSLRDAWEATGDITEESPIRQGPSASYAFQEPSESYAFQEPSENYTFEEVEKCSICLDEIDELSGSSMCQGTSPCTICYEPLELAMKAGIQVLCCDHQFHKKCIGRWLDISNSCPACRCQV
ncbi:hypothetical protein SeLEV6574_g07818 [Synchytrium endobioticum]|uniref:RING-type domain-containing protein n=1 Tax=Synchytrium endobioticum TaxID=286115 RepID=A0A507CFH8_9FUNG|nr:hypothetical protein SeLEV6574_g07818 [Synchytrium endobioticum]